MSRLCANLAVFLSLVAVVTAQPAARVPVSRAAIDVAGVAPGSGFRTTAEGTNLRVSWRMSPTQRGVLVLNPDAGAPLIETLGVETNGATRAILSRMNPVVLLTVGERDLANPAGWVAFFDNPPLRSYRTHTLVLAKRSIRAASEGRRLTVTIDDATAGSFHGRFQFTIFADSPLVLAEAVLQTQDNGRAILYDAGLMTPTPNVAVIEGGVPNWRQIAWQDHAGALRRVPADNNQVAAPAFVAKRAIAAENDTGTVTVFPPPHQYFYPLDFATNLGFAWYGRSGDQWLRGYGFGVQQPPAGDKRWVPWCNAPPGTEQRLGLFYHLDTGDAAAALAAVSRYTHDDRFKKLPGHATFSSHYHIEHALELAARRRELVAADAIPAELRTPGFIPTLKARGVDIVHLAEFHTGGMPGLPAPQRLALLKTLHDECARLSDGELLVLPGEEPNVHLGGHWISFFPRPVYWVLNRATSKPFTEEVPGYGRVYHVGGADDVLRLMEAEGGLMWTAHPRIKGSRTFPDAYFDTAFYRSERFLGGAWKSMPVDLSLPRLGSRVLDLQDDMANRGGRKYIVGEVDIFRVEPEMETYAHMNINYLRLDRVPRYADGWQPVVDALHGGRFFVSTGEVLIPSFTVNGRASGETVQLAAGDAAQVGVRLEWTFPLAFAELVSGDGQRVYRQKIDLADTGEFGTRELSLTAALAGRKWIRLEVWDVARNGAFTPPVWLE
jgi:hypothetical protein